MIRRRLEELDDLVAAINQECDQPKRFFLRLGALWCNEGNGYQVTASSLTKNQLYDALRLFLQGIVAGKRYGAGTPQHVHHVTPMPGHVHVGCKECGTAWALNLKQGA